jgi:signal transduction histidine kinase
MLPSLTQPRTNAWLATCVALWLAALLWTPACLAAPSQIVAQSFVVDPTGQMTLEQVMQQPEQTYTGALTRLLDSSVVWVRLRVAPTAGALVPATERLRLVPAWSQSLSLYDPLQRDANGRIARLDSPPTAALFTVQMFSIPVGAESRDLWLRLDSGGSVYLKASVQTLEVAEARVVSDAILQGVVIGAQALLILVGLIAWLADRRGIGHTMFTKQVFNLMMAVLNADLFLLPVLPAAPYWPEGLGTYGVEVLRVLNMAISLWFFMKVLELMQAPRWALLMQRVPLALLALCLLLVVSGQLAFARMIGLVLYLAVPLGLMVSSLACRREHLQPVTVLGLTRRVTERVGFGLVLVAAWVASFPSGVFKTQELSFFGILTPIAAICAVGVLLLVGWQRIRADRQQQVAQQHRAELNALALDFERGERQRQQEFMGMLTHELKAPLSTLGMVIGSTAASPTMKHHAELALASMRQVIDHCAQSAEIEDATAPPNQVVCSLAVAFELRCAAQAENARILMASMDALPSIMADERMLAVIFNNLLDNALKYSPHGSQINASIVRELNPQGAVQRVSVTNQALAATLPDASRLFQKYYRGDAVQRISGSGLGLHLSRLLARRMGGDLRYQADTRGVTFTLVLPESMPPGAVLA